MAAGVPAVAADHGSLPELVADTGLVHRPDDAHSLADALHRVLDPELNQTLGAAARRRYEAEFSPRAGLTNLVAGYRAAIASATPAVLS
jgi:glycosyltransferase involved in cell wall biosynthesis